MLILYIYNNYITIYKTVIGRTKFFELLFGKFS